MSTKTVQLKYPVKEYIFIVFLSYFIGESILVLSNMPLRWGVSFFLGLLLMFMGFLSKQPKQFYLTLFFFSLPIIANKNLMPPIYPHIGGPSSIYLSFYDFPLLMLYLLLIPTGIVFKKVNLSLSKEAFFMLGIICISILSMINSANFSLSLYEILRLIIMFMVFMYISKNVSSIDDIKCFIVPMLAGLLFASLIGIAQFFGIWILGLRFLGQEGAQSFRSISRVGSTLGHPNSFAIYLGYFLPITVGIFFLNLRKIYKLITSIIFSLGLLVLILTLTRAGWAGFILAVIVFLLLGLRARIFSIREALFILSILVLLLGIIMVFFYNGIFVRLFTYDYGSAASRIPLMRIALNMIKEHPLIGVGSNNYFEVMRSYGYSNINNVVHNSYLLIAAQIGIPGLLFFLSFVVLIYKKGLSLIFSKSRLCQCLSIGILAGLSSMLIQLTVENFSITHQLFFIFWILSGLIVAMEKINFLESV